MSLPPSQKAAFLAKDRYRKRRMRDLARAVPVIGGILLMLPLLWSNDTLNSTAIVYVFAVWVLLIVLAAVISRLVSTDSPKAP
ncbi:MAG: hypothetical protein ABF248_05355 [Yoonia sp.]